MNKIIVVLFFLLLGNSLEAQETQITLQPQVDQLILGWMDEDRDAYCVEALQAAYEATADKPALFFKAWAAAHAKIAKQPLATYFDQSKNLEIKKDLRDRVVLRKLKRAVRKELKQEVDGLKVFSKSKELNAKLRYQASKFKLSIRLPKEKQHELEKGVKSQGSLEIYPLYTTFELLGDGKQKGPLARLDSLWQASGDPSEALPQLEQSILEIGELGYVQTRDDPFILLVNEKDTQIIFNYLRGFLTHSLLPDAVFMATIYPQQQDESTDAYYSILVLKNNGEEMRLNAQNLNRIYIKEQEWSKALGFEMNQEATQDWANLTKNYVNQSLAIVLEGKIYSYPRVMEQITVGKVEISGDFEGSELKALKNKIIPTVLPLYWKIIKQ